MSSPPSPPLPPLKAWQPLPSSAWNTDTARHLLRRAGWAARPDDVSRAVKDGLIVTLERLFPHDPIPLERPAYIQRADERIAELQPLKSAAGSPEERQVLDREQRDLERNGAVELTLQWLQAAADPPRSAYEKWVLFLSDVYVVGMEKVYRADWMYQHFDILRTRGAGPAPELTKAVSRSPAMIAYLDLNRSSKRAPNENFARELFELFLLGEGNYTEDDIKQAARAFTGYRFGDKGFRFSERDADLDDKILFGRKARYNGDQAIDAAYDQPAAATFLPREMARFYLTDQALPAEFFEPLASNWRLGGFNLRDLCRSFFGSTIFYHPAYRANFIKSPIQYHLGLVQDLGLNVLPLPRATLNPLRQMGQQFLYPPNVRGWVGGRLWINSSTLAARRQLAISLCNPLEEDRLNADEQLELAVARDAGNNRFTVDEERIRAFTSLGPEGIADRLCDFFLPGSVSPAYRTTLVEYLKRGVNEDFEAQARRATIAVLQSPEYQLC